MFNASRPGEFSAPISYTRDTARKSLVSSLTDSSVQEDRGMLSHSDGASSPPFAEYTLSQRTIDMLVRISQPFWGANSADDGDSEWESSAILELKRADRAFDTRLVRMEEELVSIRQDCEERSRPAVLSYRQAQRTLDKERQDFETIRGRQEASLEKLSARLHCMEIELNILKSHSSEESQNRADVNDVLASIQGWAATASDRISQLEMEGFLRLPTASQFGDSPEGGSARTTTDTAESSADGSLGSSSLADELSWGSASKPSSAPGPQERSSQEIQDGVPSDPVLSTSDLELARGARASHCVTRIRDSSKASLCHTDVSIPAITQSDTAENFILLVACVVLAHYLVGSAFHKRARSDYDLGTWFGPAAH
ncbi:hypothetical protein BV20DRAFT_976326 [Pilatotrama ljubarskyi]|nr:hypothetical protein BV20DRAFT_976326 [Pilatotrama ljubarskyi]